MSEQHVHYITQPLKSFIFTLSADSGLQQLVSLYPQETERLSIRDKIENDNLEMLCTHRNETSSVILLHLCLITYKLKTGLFHFNKTHF